jgi:hypothetical protein
MPGSISDASNPKRLPRPSLHQREFDLRSQSQMASVVALARKRKRSSLSLRASRCLCFSVASRV